MMSSAWASLLMLLNWNAYPFEKQINAIFFCKPVFNTLWYAGCLKEGIKMAQQNPKNSCIHDIPRLAMPMQLSRAWTHDHFMAHLRKLPCKCSLMLWRICNLRGSLRCSEHEYMSVIYSMETSSTSDFKYWVHWYWSKVSIVYRAERLFSQNALKSASINTPKDVGAETGVTGGWTTATSPERTAQAYPNWKVSNSDWKPYSVSKYRAIPSEWLGVADQ